MDKNIRVLLVDDEETFILNLARILKRRGFEVSTAFDGYKAVDAVKSEPAFDVVVLDVKMPGMDGIETLKAIKETTPNTEVIMLTGHATLENGIQAIRSGAFDYLMKPCDIEDLTEKIREAYEVESIRLHPVLWPRKLVKEITLPSFIRLEPGDSLGKALQVFDRQMGKMAREELYVLDEEDRFKGVVSKRDILDAAGSAHPEKAVTWADLEADPALMPDIPLREIMREQHPVTTHPDEDLTGLARRMIAGNVRCMPVVEEGRVTGIIRLQDIFRYVEQENA